MSFIIINRADLNAAVDRLAEAADCMKWSGRAAVPNTTNGVVPPGKDCVSKEAAERLVAHANRCLQVTFRASNALFRFADNLKISAAAYSAAEADNTQALGGLAEGDTSTANISRRDTSPYQPEGTKTNTAGPYAPDNYVKHYAKYCTLSPEINSDNIHNGYGPESLENAIAAWKNLEGDMRIGLSEFKKALTELQAKWSGPAATQMAEAAAEYQNWLENFAERIGCTHKQIDNIPSAFLRTRAKMVSPNDIAENRQKAKEAAESYDLEAPHRKAQLEFEYQDFTRKDVAEMKSYDEAVNRFLSMLPSWEDPPLLNAALPVGPRPRNAR